MSYFTQTDRIFWWQITGGDLDWDALTFRLIMPQKKAPWNWMAHWFNHLSSPLQFRHAGRRVEFYRFQHPMLTANRRQDRFTTTKSRTQQISQTRSLHLLGVSLAALGVEPGISRIPSSNPNPDSMATSFQKVIIYWNDYNFDWQLATLRI